MKSFSRNWAISATLLPLAMTLSHARKPNVVIIMTDQQRADLTAREGFPLDLTPFADSMGRAGIWFDRAYTPCPASGPARVSLLTGRFPRVTHTDSNHNIADAVFTADLFGTARAAGYKTVLVGKNHTYMDRSSADDWIPYNHLGQEKPGKDTLRPEALSFDRFLGSTSFYASLEPSPGGLEEQLPYRIVTDALRYADANRENPFVMWMSFPEPHNPYQVCEPYFSMFEGRIPPARTDASAQAVKGEKYVQLAEMMKLGHKGYDRNLERLRANYMGMIRLLDDQMRRFYEGMEALGLADDTVFVILSDHGDYAGEYGLMKKGAGVGDMLTRVPMVWFGAGVTPSGRSDAHVSLVDVFPTVCEMIGEPVPAGVQGRSLTEILSGRPYPASEFRSILSESGFGGQYITAADYDDYVEEGAVGRRGLFFDELNSWSQSGTISMVRMGDWKLVCDMLGNCELYNLRKDPSEMKNLYGRRRVRKIQSEMMREMLRWQISTVDPVPYPRHRYHYKTLPHNYLFSAED